MNNFMKGGEIMNILNSKESNIREDRETRENIETSRGEWKKTHLSKYDESNANYFDNSSKNDFGAPLLGDSRDLFRPKTSDIPNQPGVYKCIDDRGKVIYVGKSKSLIKDKI